LLSTSGLGAGWLYKVQEVKPNIFAWVPDDVLDLDGDPQFERAGTAGFIITSQGAVVVDTTNTPFHGRELLYEVRHHTELPVRYVIDTNSSGEQILGNEVFTEQQATLVSSVKTQEQILGYREQLADRLADPKDKGKLQDRMRGIHVTVPTETFATEMSLQLGGQDIKLLSLLKNGAGDDAVVYLPAAKVIFLGELFANHYFPRIDSRNVHDWANVLGQVEKWDADVYVPGQGEPGGKKELEEFRQFLDWFGKEVETRILQGKSASQVEREVGPLLENYQWHARELFPEEVEAIYRQKGISPAGLSGPSQPTDQVPPAAQPSTQP
jgi:glyoxylase-like metal-dependent hydrolase (beta-lactamase superfamily II)